jgi:hypothetical protein
MRFLIKAGLWLSIVVLLLPGDAAKQEPRVSPFDALGAAQAAVEDASSFCERKPDACEIGSQAFQSFGEKAQYGAKMLYEFLTARFAGENAATGSIRTPHRPGHHTLSPRDLEPAWSGPEQRSVPMPPRRPV